MFIKGENPTDGLLRDNIGLIPADILALQDDLLGLEKEISELKDFLKFKEAEELLNVANDKSLGNADLKKAKVTVILYNKYKKEKSDLRDLYTKRDALKNKIDYYDREWRASTYFYKRNNLIIEKDVYKEGSNDR